MYQYEMQQFRSAELIRQAERERLAREAVRMRRAARREAALRSDEADTDTRRPRRHWFARTA